MTTRKRLEVCDEFVGALLGGNCLDSESITRFVFATNSDCGGSTTVYTTSLGLLFFGESESYRA
jgi:hypothetical protein